MGLICEVEVSSRLIFTQTLLPLALLPSVTPLFNNIKCKCVSGCVCVGGGSNTPWNWKYQLCFFFVFFLKTDQLQHLCSFILYPPLIKFFLSFNVFSSAITLYHSFYKANLFAKIFHQDASISWFKTDSCFSLDEMYTVSECTTQHLSFTFCWEREIGKKLREVIPSSKPESIPSTHSSLSRYILYSNKKNYIHYLRQKKKVF